MPNWTAAPVALEYIFVFLYVLTMPFAIHDDGVEFKAAYIVTIHTISGAS
jgi:hypothetical protein